MNNGEQLQNDLSSTPIPSTVMNQKRYTEAQPWLVDEYGINANFFREGIRKAFESAQATE